MARTPLPPTVHTLLNANTLKFDSRQNLRKIVQTKPFRKSTREIKPCQNSALTIKASVTMVAPVNPSSALSTNNYWSRRISHEYLSRMIGGSNCDLDLTWIPFNCNAFPDCIVIIVIIVACAAELLYYCNCSMYSTSIHSDWLFGEYISVLPFQLT